MHGWVVVIPQVFEPRHHLVPGSKEHEAAQGQQQGLVKHCPDGSTRLMDGCHNAGATHVRDGAQVSHDLEGCKAVQTTGGFIQEHNAGGGHDAGGNGQALTFTTRQTTEGQTSREVAANLQEEARGISSKDYNRKGMSC